MADWTFYVHNDGRYASINDGKSGDTILRIGGQPGDPGWGDVEKAREFEQWLRDLRLQWEEELLSKRALRAAAAVFYPDIWPGDESEMSVAEKEEAAKIILKEALAASKEVQDG